MSRPARPQLTPLRRHVAAILTIALSTAFVAVLVLAGNLMTTSISQSAESEYRGADLVIDTSARASETDADGTYTAPPAPTIDGATAVWPQSTGYVEMQAAGGSGTPAYVQLRTIPPQAAVPTAMREGREATRAGEITLSPIAAAQLGVGVGGALEVSTYDDQGEEVTMPLTVVGILDTDDAESALLATTTPWAVLTEANAKTLTGMTLEESAFTWYASLPDGADAQQVADASSTDDVSVITAQDAITRAKAQGLSGMVAMGSIFGVFVVIALLTAAVVVGNTFTVTLAQRTRDLALLRTLGATRRQVTATVRGESLRVGLLGSLIGAAAGHLLAQAALLAAHLLGWTPGIAIVPVSVLSVLLPVVAGVIVTVVAGIAPLRRATRVAPLEALRPIEASSEGPGRVRTIGSIAAFVAGLGLLLGGTSLSLLGQNGLGLLLAVLGGVVSFAALLAGLVVITPAATRLLGRLVRRLGGVPAAVAAANTLRHPRRSAATISALLIGTTLMTMMAVGAHTAEVSLNADLDNRKPIDVIIRAESLPDDAIAQVQAVQGIGAAELVPTAEADLGASTTMTLYGPGAEQIDATAVRSDLSRRMADDVLLTGADRAERFGLTAGQTVSIPAADGGTVDLRVVVDGNLDMSLVTGPTLSRISGDGAGRAIFARFAAKDDPTRAGLDSSSIVMNLRDAVDQGGFVDAQITAEGTEREAYGQILSVLLAITLGLLAVAVLVALVGVTNTLSLGVVERTGENALLRALGTTRGQMRAMLGWEGFLLAVIGAVIGVLLGMLYGTLGIMAIFGTAFPTVVTVPWVQLLSVIAGTLVAGLLASVLPARRAAAVAPAQALAAADG